MDKKAVIEALKEAGRLAFFAALAAVVAYASDKLTTLDPSSLYVVLGTALLRVADRFVHENKNVKAKGIAPF